jgi:hypothetical protein
LTCSPGSDKSYDTALLKSTSPNIRTTINGCAHNCSYQSQLAALFWLLDELISQYGFTVKDIYAHGIIAHKDRKKSEGAASLREYYRHDFLKTYYLYLQGAGQL